MISTTAVDRVGGPHASGGSSPAASDRLGTLFEYAECGIVRLLYGGSYLPSC